MVVWRRLGQLLVRSGLPSLYEGIQLMRGLATMSGGSCAKAQAALVTSGKEMGHLGINRPKAPHS